MSVHTVHILCCVLPEQVGYGVTANIAASHAAARGSIPRIRMSFFLLASTIIFLVNHHHAGVTRPNLVYPRVFRYCI